jgi:sortase A
MIPGIAFRTIEKLLWIAGTAAISYSIAYITYGTLFQRLGERELATALRPNAPPSAHQKPGSVMGRVQIPRLHISAVVFEGTSESELRKGVGHWIDSPMDGSGNVVLAAHRDTFFRGLGEIREGDFISLETSAGIFSYIVSGTSVVWPDAVQVLRGTSSPTLTLITCFPFDFFGRAPQRFIVRAQERDGAEAPPHAIP